MNEYRPEISRDNSKLNSCAPGGLGRAVRDVIPQIQAALEKQRWSMPAPIKNGTGRPPKEPKPAAFARALAQSALLDSVERLPIFGPALTSSIGCSFRLGEVTLKIPTGALGPPWDRN